MTDISRKRIEQVILDLRPMNGSKEMDAGVAMIEDLYTRVEELEKQISDITSDRPYTTGFNTGYETAQEQAVQGAVKPLVWDKHPDEQEWYAKLDEQEGDNFERGYMILPAKSHFTLYDGFASRARVLGHYTIAPDAKAAAQADYERRILSAFTTPPADAKRADFLTKIREGDVLATEGAEARYIEDGENACPACGGSGHKGDAADAIAEAVKAADQLADAADCIHHWHDAMRDSSGMVVSADHVRKLWAARDAYRTVRARGEEA